jgi:O-antigen/teichoic acid export membrane protein
VDHGDSRTDGEPSNRTIAVPKGLDAVEILDAPTAGGKVIRGSVPRIAGYLAGVLLAVLAATLMTRHLGVVGWGQYITVTSLVTIVSGLSEAGLSAIGTREYATREGDERARLMRNLLGLRLAITVVGVAGALVFAIAAGYDSVLVVGTLLAGLALPLMVAQQMYMIPLGTALRIGLVSAVDLARQLATTLVVVALVVAGAGLLPFLAIPLPVGLALVLLTVFLVRGAIPLRPAFEPAQWKHVFVLTIVYSAAAAVGSIYGSLTVVIASLVATSTELGYYGVSFRIFSVLAVLPFLGVYLAFPILSRAALNDETRLKYAMERLFEASLIFGAWIALATSLGARFAIGVVAGPDFEPAVAVLQIQGVALLATSLASTWSTGFLALHRHRVVLLANLLGLAMSGLLTGLLVGPYGAKGAAIATVGGEFTLALAYTVALLGGDRRLGIPVGVIPKVAAATAAALALALVPGLDGLALVLAASAAYFAVLWAVRGIPEELHTAFLDRMNRKAKA